MRHDNPDFWLLELIHSGKLETVKLNVPHQWGPFSDSLVGSCLRAYLIVKVSKLQTQLVHETDRDSMLRLQGKLLVLRDLLRIVEASGGREVSEEVSAYVTEMRSKK